MTADDPGAPRELEPSLAVGCEFQGILVLRGPGRIDGSLAGEIVGSDLVWIGESARVEADVEAEEVVVEGHLEGRVSARRRIALRPTAHVVGSVAAPSVEASDGCFLEGRCITTPPAGDEPPPAAAAASS